MFTLTYSVTLFATL